MFKAVILLKFTLFFHYLKFLMTYIISRVFTRKWNQIWVLIIFLACYVSNTSVSYSWKILLVHICFIFGKEKKVYWSLLFYVIYCNHKKMSRVVYGNENSNLYIKHHHLLLQRQLFSHFYPFTWNTSNKKDHLHYSF